MYLFMSLFKLLTPFEPPPLSQEPFESYFFEELLRLVDVALRVSVLVLQCSESERTAKLLRDLVGFSHFVQTVVFVLPAVLVHCQTYRPLIFILFLPCLLHVVFDLDISVSSFADQLHLPLPEFLQVFVQGLLVGSVLGGLWRSISVLYFLEFVSILVLVGNWADSNVI